MPYRRKATDEQILDAYERHKSVWKAAEELGMCGQSVYERLQKLNAVNSRNVMTKEDEEYLAERYILYRDAGILQDLADEMGRTKQYICRYARSLGLTDTKHEQKWHSFWKNMPFYTADKIWQNFKKSPLTVTEYCKEMNYASQSFISTMNRYFPDEYDEVIFSKAGEQSTYRVGIGFEFSVRDDLKHHGYIAMRSPGSRSPSDVYAFKYGEMVFVQCRVNGSLHPQEWNIFFDYCRSVGATPILAQKGEGKPIMYWRLTDMKVPGKNQTPQPKEPWEPSEGAASSVNGVTSDHMDITVTFEMEE